MYKKIALAGLGLVLLSTPLFTSADPLSDMQAQLQALLVQLTALQQQSAGSTNQQTTGTAVYTTPSTPTPTCSGLSGPLGLGTQNSAVVALQNFLIAQGLFAQGNVTGFFGPLTEGAVEALQTQDGIVSSGDPASTGFGTVGPRTLAVILAQCGITSQTTAGAPAQSGTGASAPAVASCVNAPKPTDSCATAWVATSAINGCILTWQCTSQSALNSSVQNTPPSISSISGPTSLTVGTTGSWAIQASDSEGGTLLYDLSFGDTNDSSFSQIQSIAQNSASTLFFGTATTFTHTFSSPGTYTLTARVQDSAGNISERSLTVIVTTPSSSPDSSSSGLSLLPGTNTSSADIPPYGTLITMPPSGTCPSRSMPIVAYGYCLSIGPVVPSPAPVCAAGTHQTVGAGCLPDAPAGPPAVSACPAGFLQTIGGCLQEPTASPTQCPAGTYSTPNGCISI